MIEDFPWRPAAPHIGTFANFRDAVAEASFRAAVTQRRYRVIYEPNNCWWQITEGFRPPRRTSNPVDTYPI